MKSDKIYISKFIKRILESYIIEAEQKEEPAKEEGGEEDANPFAAAEGEGDDKAEDDKETEKKSEQPAGIPLQFNISKVKQYNKSNFLSDKGIVKSIDKRGIIVTTQPDNVDVLVNFSDISESVKKFFKNKK